MVKGWRTCSVRRGWWARASSAWKGENTAVGGLTAACPYIWRGHWGGRYRISTAVHGRRMRGNGYDLKQERFILGLKRNIFPLRTGRQWSGLPREPSWSPSLEVFKTSLEKALNSLYDLVADPTLSWRLDDRSPEVLSKLNYPVILRMGLRCSFTGKHQQNGLLIGEFH